MSHGTLARYDVAICNSQPGPGSPNDDPPGDAAVDGLVHEILDQDCSIPDRNYQLRATATHGSESATNTHLTGLCSPQAP